MTGDVAGASGCLGRQFPSALTGGERAVLLQWRYASATGVNICRTGAQLVELNQVWQRIADLETSHDTTARSRGYRFLNREFHLVIHQMAHSRVMAELSERMWDMSDFFINTIGGAEHLSEALTDRNHDHDVIRSSIRSRSAEVARVAMQSHIVETVGLFGDDLDNTA
jgi:DNA-binding GntR family transcriptional regulator